MRGTVIGHPPTECLDSNALEGYERPEPYRKCWRVRAPFNGPPTSYPGGRKVRDTTNSLGRAYILGPYEACLTTYNTELRRRESLRLTTKRLFNTAPKHRSSCRIGGPGIGEDSGSHTRGFSIVFHNSDSTHSSITNPTNFVLVQLLTTLMQPAGEGS